MPSLPPPFQHPDSKFYIDTVMLTERLHLALKTKLAYLCGPHYHCL